MAILYSEKAYNLRDYTKGNNFTYLSTEDATYTFPVYDNKNLKTFSCATFLQQVLLDMGYTQFAGSEKIYAYTKPAYAKYNFENLGFEVEIITDQTKFQPGDILNAKSAYHTFIVTEVKDDKSVVCMGYPEVRNYPNGRIRSQQELKNNGYYAVRVVGIKQ